MAKHIPNLLTLINLFLGCLAIVSVFDQNLTQAGIYLAIAAVIDFFDGFIARLLNVSGEFGKQLDSLADVVSFGVAPGLIFYSLQQNYMVFGPDFFQYIPLMFVISYLPFLIPVCSALRLARFNTDARQTYGFIGLPTPANAMFIISIPYVLENGPSFADDIFTSNTFLILFPLISSFLLISNLPMFAFKFKSFDIGSNLIRYLFLLISILLLVFFKFFGISLIITVYIILSLIFYIKKNKHEV